jgi:DNA-binding LytR/AlgR family response regulator
MIQILKKPVIRTGTSRERLVMVLVFGLFIFLFLFVFKPFGMNTFRTGQQFFLSAGFGIVTAFVLFIFKFLIEPVIMKTPWSLGKNLLWDMLIIFCIGVANYFYISIVFKQSLQISNILTSIWVTFLVAIIPVTISYFITYNRIYRKALREADIKPADLLPEEEITLRAGNTRNLLRLNQASIVYLCSNDNYVTVVTTTGETLSKKTIRGTLKASERELAGDRRFLRCHKCYIININYAQSLKGHSQNKTIRLSVPGPEIPVSRSKSEYLSKVIEKG